MDGYESTRRSFIRKLGLTMGAAAVGSVARANSIIEDKIQFPLEEDQAEFMNNYDRWMDEFIEVIKERRNNPDDLNVNKRLMALSEEAEAWQNQLNEFMQDENFARHYMIATERMTEEIG
jgi:hypothetical protein